LADRQRQPPGATIFQAAQLRIDHTNGTAVYDRYQSSVTAANPVVDLAGVGDRDFETPSGASATPVCLVKGPDNRVDPSSGRCLHAAQRQGRRAGYRSRLPRVSIARASPSGARRPRPRLGPCVAGPPNPSPARPNSAHPHGKPHLRRTRPVGHQATRGDQVCQDHRPSHVLARRLSVLIPRRRRRPPYSVGLPHGVAGAGNTHGPPSPRDERRLT
jgi:hypothetical protein